MLAPILITAPAADPVTLAEAKAHLRVDFADDDALIAALIKAATGHLDGWTGVLGRALITQTWEESRADWSDMRLSLWPVASVASVRYVDAAGAEQTVPAADYELLADARGAYVALKPGKAWPPLGEDNRPVRIRYVAGQAAADVPAPIKAALLLMVGDLYRNRETVVMGAVNAVPMSATVEALLAPFRRATF